MPKRKKSNLSRNTKKATYMRNKRAKRTDEQIKQDNEIARVNISRLRASQSQETRAKPNLQQKLAKRRARQSKAITRKANDLQQQSKQRQARRSVVNPREANDRQQQSKQRQARRSVFNPRKANDPQQQSEQKQEPQFVVNTRRADQKPLRVYQACTLVVCEPDIEYPVHPEVLIGAMDKECPHCHAPEFNHESAGMCCASRKVQPEIETPPEPLNGYS